MMQQPNSSHACERRVIMGSRQTLSSSCLQLAGVQWVPVQQMVVLHVPSFACSHSLSLHV